MIPKEIVEKMEQVNSLMLEIDKWMFDNIETEGSKHETRGFDDCFRHEDYYQFTDEPAGEEQGNGEYCAQSCIGEDSYYGQYYHPTEKGNYFWYDYSI